MKLKIFIAVFIVIIVVFVVYSANKIDAFSPAKDFPGNALVFAQIADLPAFIKLWNESDFKEKYTASENFKDFQNNHLGRKLASRWKEFNDAAGFPFDSEAISRLTENRASLALYDVGKLEFVFIAPMNGEIFAATKFLQNQDKFEQETLDDGTNIYRAAVAADRGRQQQELLFTNVKGRFILATSEKLMAQTLNNINGNQSVNRLSDDLSFKLLSEKIEPRLATVWVNQTALNSDYYFKRYWLTADVKDLRNIRAGIFDLELTEGKLIERRRFLLAEPIEILPIEPDQAAKMLSYLPEKIPFYQLRKANSEIADETIQKTIFDRADGKTIQKRSRHFYDSSSDFTDDYSEGDYSYLSGKFDESIDENEADETIQSRKTGVDFSQSFQSANPQVILTFSRPQMLPAPLFVNFKRAAIINLAAPEAFDRESFESAIAKNFAAQTMISAPNIGFKWETKTEGMLSWHELKLPMLEWKAVYLLRGNELILANDSDFLLETASAENRNIEKQENPLSTLTVINSGERDSAFGDIFDDLADKDAADTFFTDNIESLLDSASSVGKIAVRKNYSQNILEEELTFNY